MAWAERSVVDGCTCGRARARPAARKAGVMGWAEGVRARERVKGTRTRQSRTAGFGGTVRGSMHARASRLRCHLYEDLRVVKRVCGCLFYIILPAQSEAERRLCGAELRTGQRQFPRPVIVRESRGRGGCRRPHIYPSAGFGPCPCGCFEAEAPAPSCRRAAAAQVASELDASRTDATFTRPIDSREGSCGGDFSALRPPGWWPPSSSASSSRGAGHARTGWPPPRRSPIRACPWPAAWPPGRASAARAGSAGAPPPPAPP